MRMFRSAGIGRDFGLTASYLYTRGNRLPVYRNINLVPSGQTSQDRRPIFSTARVLPAYNGILSAESVGKSVYNGLNISVNRRYAHGNRAVRNVYMVPCHR